MAHRRSRPPGVRVNYLVSVVVDTYGTTDTELKRLAGRLCFVRRLPLIGKFGMCVQSISHKPAESAAPGRHGLAAIGSPLREELGRHRRKYSPNPLVVARFVGSGPSCNGKEPHECGHYERVARVRRILTQKAASHPAAGQRGPARGTGPCFRSGAYSLTASSRRKMDQSPIDV